MGEIPIHDPSKVERWAKAIPALLDKHDGSLSNVADDLGTTRETLIGLMDRTAIGDAIRQGYDRIYDDVQAFLTRCARGNNKGVNPASAIFTMKVQRGWNEKQEIHHTGFGADPGDCVSAKEDPEVQNVQTPGLSIVRGAG